MHRTNQSAEDRLSQSQRCSWNLWELLGSLPLLEVFGNVASTEPTAVHSHLLSSDGTLTQPLGAQALWENASCWEKGQEVTLVLRLVMEDAMPVEQLQHSLGLCSEKLVVESLGSSSCKMGIRAGARSSVSFCHHVCFH